MTGIGFILHENGWSCSNDVLFDVEYDRIDVDGQKLSKHTIKLKFNCIFDGVGLLSVGLPVYCLFKEAEDKGFTGEITKIGTSIIEVTVKTKTDKLTEIKNKIKSWQHNLTY